MKDLIFVLAAGFSCAALWPSLARADTNADAAIAGVAHEWAGASYATPDDRKVAAYEDALAAADADIEKIAPDLLGK